MALNLLEHAENYLTPELIQRAGVLVNETPEKTERAMSCIVPALLAGALDSASSPAGIARLTELTEMISNGGFENTLTAFTSDQAGSNLNGFVASGELIVAALFDGSADSINENIARNSGIRQGSAASLMALAAPLVMGIVGREVRDRGLSGSSMRALLIEQRESIVRNLPTGLGSLLSWQTTTTTGSPRARISSDELPVAPPKPNRAALWLATLMLLASGTVLISWLRTPDPQTRGRLASIHLPGGSTLHASETSMNYALANYLGRHAGQEQERRFVFDSLKFTSGSAQPADQSIQIIRDLGMILRAYPQATVRLEGYTDNTGDAAANKELSQQRAESIKALLVQNGVDASHIETAGLGSDNPIGSNDTEAGRLINRRTELVVHKP
ncbi:MAG TPA: OmpA family protein [Bryobacteraceae bacterium]|nr:OmpA family protein [Bryobacteraceae bacterium]